MDIERVKPLYRWLIEDKGYTESEADETIIRYDNGMTLPKDVLSDLREYTEIFIDRFIRR